MLLYRGIYNAKDLRYMRHRIGCHVLYLWLRRQYNKVDVDQALSISGLHLISGPFDGTRVIFNISSSNVDAQTRRSFYAKVQFCCISHVNVALR